MIYYDNEDLNELLVRVTSRREKKPSTEEMVRLIATARDGLEVRDLVLRLLKEPFSFKNLCRLSDRVIPTPKVNAAGQPIP